MLTAHRLFGGETISDSIGAILHKEPPWELLPAATPPQVHQLLRRCLERDPKSRLRDVGDARVALEEARRDPTGSSMGLSAAPMTAAPATGRRGLALGLAGVVVGAVLGVLLGVLLLKPAPEAPPLRKSRSALFTKPV